MGLGSTIGSVAGGIGGTALGLPPQVGAAVGGAIGGIGDSIAAKAKKKKAEGMLPEMVDPMEANRYAEMRLREKQLMTGTAFQTALGENRKTQAATIAGVNQASGGAGGAAIAAMLRADALAGRTNNETLGKGLEEQNFLSQEMTALATRIAQRKFALQKQKYQQALYDSTAAQGEANSDVKAQAARTNFQPIVDMISGMGNNGDNPIASGAAQVAKDAYMQRAQLINNPFVKAPSPVVNPYATNPLTAGFYSPTSNVFQNPFVAAPSADNAPELAGSIPPAFNLGFVNSKLNFKGGDSQVSPTQTQPAPQSSSVISQQPQAVPQTTAPPQPTAPQSSSVISQQPQAVPQTTAPPQPTVPQDPKKDLLSKLDSEQNRYYNKGLNNGNNPQNMKDFHNKYYTTASEIANKYVGKKDTPELQKQEFDESIDKFMDYEKANEPKKDANGNYIWDESWNGGGTNWGTNNPKITTKEQAKQYYKDKYWNNVKDLPAGLRTRAFQMAINTGDPYGELMVASGLMTVEERSKTKGNRKDLPLDELPQEYKDKINSIISSWNGTAQTTPPTTNTP